MHHCRIIHLDTRCVNEYTGTRATRHPWSIDLEMPRSSSDSDERPPTRGRPRKTFRLGVIPQQQQDDSRIRRTAEPSAGHEERPGRIEGLYIISVAARILDMHPQTLRKYERVGLLSPSRTVGMLRLYSEEDVARLRLIKHLVGDLGLNLAGVQLALEMFNLLIEVRARMDNLADDDPRGFLEESLEEMMSLLYSRMP